MRRSPLTRFLSALFAVWLALVMGDAGLVGHHCPMHDGTLAAAGSMDLHGGHAGHGDHGAPNGGHHACTCLGACSASSEVTLAGPVEVPVPAALLVTTAAPDAPGAATPVARAHFSLPFANGPPAAIA
jgi:hypothetical protein